MKPSKKMSKQTQNTKMDEREDRSSRSLMAILAAGEVKIENGRVRMPVGNSPGVVENINEQGIAVTNEGGHPVVMKTGGIAIAGQGGNANVGESGLAYVSTGIASGEADSVAITRGAGTAEVGDRGLAIAMSGGNASVGRGVAVALNARDDRDYKATAMGRLGAVLVFGYFKDSDEKTKIEYVFGKVDNVNIEPNVPYHVTKEGNIRRVE
jgi:hypothetical protein